jgi:hypothetical protein
MSAFTLFNDYHPPLPSVTAGAGGIKTMHTCIEQAQGTHVRCFTEDQFADPGCVAYAEAVSQGPEMVDAAIAVREDARTTTQQKRQNGFSVCTAVQSGVSKT